LTDRLQPLRDFLVRIDAENRNFRPGTAVPSAIKLENKYN
jgi:hypothetical protein